MRASNHFKGGFPAAFFVACFFVLPFVTNAQQDTLRLMFYNVENLFDTIDQPEVHDEDFTPEGKYNHTSKRYQTKLIHLNRVINRSFESGAPHLIGLCEVENRQVLRDLVATNDSGDWRVLQRDSPDQRGIDNALLYDARELTLTDSNWLTIDLGEEERPTREILEATLLWKGKHKLIVYVNHWPSRYGGAEASNWKRVMASDVLTKRIKEMAERDSAAYWVIMGDLNDHPDNESVRALTDCDSGLCLYNTVEKYVGTDAGSHAYRGEWGILDHIITSKNLLHGGELKLLEDRSGFVKLPFMLYYNERSGAYFPSRTYGGSNYYGGYSDHLPVKAVLTTR